MVYNMVGSSDDGGDAESVNLVVDDEDHLFTRCSCGGVEHDVAAFETCEDEEERRVINDEIFPSLRSVVPFLLSAEALERSSDAETRSAR